MSCLKNPKKWLWIKYNGDHSYKPKLITKFMKSSDDFIVHFECTLCGCKTNRNFVTWEELLELGITNEQIEKVAGYLGNDLWL